MKNKLATFVFAAALATLGSSTTAATLRVDFASLPVEEIGLVGPRSISGGFTFDNETYVVSNVNIVGRAATYDTGLAGVYRNRFRLTFGTGPVSRSPTVMTFTFLGGLAAFNDQVERISTTSPDEFLRADIREVGQTGVPLIARGFGVAMRATVVDPPAVPLPASLPLLAAALGFLGWRRKRAA